jgi:hypothetical protein
MPKINESDAELIRKYGHRQPSVWGLLLTVVIGVIVFGYLFGSVLSRDWFWFWPEFDAMPQAVILHCYGDQVRLSPDSPHMVELAALVNSQLSGSKRWDEMTLADNLEYYRTNPSVISLELQYAQPVRIHSYRVFFSGIDTLITPLEGANSKTNPYFGLKGALPTYGSIHVENNQFIRDYIQTNQLCPQS